MLAKLVGVVGRFVVGMLALVGLAVVVIIWRMVDGAGKPAVGQAPVAVVEATEVAQKAEAPDVSAPVVGQGSAAESCECAAGAVCVGPKGGRYCLRPDGSKKYIGGSA